MSNIINLIESKIRCLGICFSTYTWAIPWYKTSQKTFYTFLDFGIVQSTFMSILGRDKREVFQLRVKEEYAKQSRLYSTAPTNRIGFLLGGASAHCVVINLVDENSASHSLQTVPSLQTYSAGSHGNISSIKSSGNSHKCEYSSYATLIIFFSFQEEIPITPNGKTFRSSEWTIKGSISKDLIFLGNQLELAYGRQTEEKKGSNPRNAVLLPNCRISPHRNLMWN